MTDTLADSRSTSRMFTEGVPVVVEDLPRRSATERAELLADPGFGRYFTDTMFVARYRTGEGWVDARLTAYAPLQMDPSAAALHYAQSIFEGLKAYAQPDGSVATFRPEANAARFTRSARRLAMPPVPEEASSPPSTRSSRPTATGCPPGRTRRCTCGPTSWPSSRSSASGR